MAKVTNVQAEEVTVQEVVENAKASYSPQDLETELQKLKEQRVVAAYNAIDAVQREHNVVLGVFVQSDLTGNIEPLASVLPPGWKVHIRPVAG
jgi:hypothetical protein